MNLAEAQRQYQVALEHRRAGRNALEGLVSLEDERADLEVEFSQAERAVEVAWLGHAMNPGA